MSDVGKSENDAVESSEASATEVVRFNSTRFGEIEIDADKLIHFPAGLVGFINVTRFAILQNPSGGPFQWLHSVDEPHLAFVVADPDLFFEDYDVPANQDELDLVEVTSLENAILLVILVVPADPKGITANLRGPIVINTEKRLGCQLVLQDPRYPTRQPVFSQIREAAGAVAAAGGE